MMRSTTVAASILALALAMAPGSDLRAEGEAGKAEPYELVVVAKGRIEATFSGWVAINGSRTELGRQTTPFRFLCGNGEAIEGRFHVLKQDRVITVEIVNHATQKAAAAATGNAVRFAWSSEETSERYVKVTTEPDSGSEDMAAGASVK